MTRTWTLQRAFIPLFGVFLTILLWGAILTQDQRTSEINEDVVRVELINYARFLESHTRSVIRGLDQVVTHLKAEYEDDPDQFDLKTQVALSPILKGLTVQVGIIDADGYLSASTAGTSKTGAERIYLGDREHFRIPARMDTSQLFVSKPVLGRASGKWSIQLVRRINDKDGAFNGVIVVSLSPDYITDIYRKIELGKQAAIVVVGRDGVQRARAAGDDRTPGQVITETPYFTELWQQQEGFVTGAIASDAVMHVGAFRQLEDYPLAVIVSRPIATVAERRAYEHSLFLATGYGGTILILGGTVLLLILALRQQRIERDLRQREGELIWTRNDLERRNRDMEQFTEVLAHHLQEPVRLQIAYAARVQKLLGDSLDGDARRALDHVVAGANRLRALLRDVQLYLAVGMLPPAIQPCDPNTVLDAALVRLNLQISQTGADIRRQNLPHAIIAPDRLIDVFTALIENALTHRQPDIAPVIDIAATTEGDNHTFTVTDSGIGIPEEFRERVFRVFERLNPESGRPGTGIGLPLVKRIIEAAHGRVWIEAPKDGGTRFCFTLPARPE